MATQLGVFNQALIQMGERTLASTSEREPGRVLTEVWNDVMGACLEAGNWNFAMRTTSLTTAGSGGGMGFTNVFTLPSDLIHVFAVGDAADMTDQFVRNAAVMRSQLFANPSPINLRYTSNDATNGGALLSIWPKAFAMFVASYLAADTCYRITGNAQLAAHLEQVTDLRLERLLRTEHVPSLPGLLPFNADARRPAYEVSERPPVEVDPFQISRPQAQPQPKEAE